MEIRETEGTDEEFKKINQLYDECLSYLQENQTKCEDLISSDDPDYDSIHETSEVNEHEHKNVDEQNKQRTASTDETDKKNIEEINQKTSFKVEHETHKGSVDSIISEPRSERLRKLSLQLPKIIITSSLDLNDLEDRQRHTIVNGPRLVNGKASSMNSMYNTSAVNNFGYTSPVQRKRPNVPKNTNMPLPHRSRHGYGEHPKRLVSKTGLENVALISNVPFEKIRLLNDTFHTLINLRWRWIVSGTIVVHFAIWLVFAVFWYITALAHYDFEPNPPNKTCITGGKDFVTIFLASVESQTTIGFGDRAIDEECPESIFLLLMQLILGTGLSGVLTCVVYAKLTRPEKLSRDGVGFSKKAVISMRDGHLCLMMRVWDLNYDHIINSEFSAHFVNTHRTKEGEVIRYYARSLSLQQRQFLLWPVTLVHVIDVTSPLYGYTPEFIANNSYEITLSLKGASASMGTFTQSQTSYLPREVMWGHRFLPVVKYDTHKRKYTIDHTKLDELQSVDTPHCSARDLYRNSSSVKSEPPPSPGSPGSFSDKVSGFQLERSSSFRNKSSKA